MLKFGDLTISGCFFDQTGNSVKMGLKEIIGLYIIQYHVKDCRNEDIKDIPIEGRAIKRRRVII